jgi:hypothetical protein
VGCGEDRVTGKPAYAVLMCGKLSLSGGGVGLRFKALKLDETTKLPTGDFYSSPTDFMNNTTRYNDGHYKRACRVLCPDIHGELVERLSVKEWLQDKLGFSRDDGGGPAELGAAELPPGARHADTLELAREVARHAGVACEVQHRPLPTDDPMQRKPDISLARRVLGWEPTVPLREGLGRTIDWFRSVRIDDYRAPTPNS